MRTNKNLLIFTFAVCCTILTAALVFSYEAASPEALIQEYADSINDDDMERYIRLFTSDNQEEMEEYVNLRGAESFFREESVKTEDIRQLSDRVGRRSSAVSDDEISKYEDVAVYYTDMMVKAKDPSDEYVKSGHHFRNFVFVKENGAWKILRVSSPDLKLTIEAGEGFHTIEEQEALARQEHA